MKSAKQFSTLKEQGNNMTTTQKLRSLKNFVGTTQMQIMSQNVKDFDEVIESLYSTVTTMPKTYETEGKNAKAMLHYFVSNNDWYIFERDTEEEQLQAFGFAIIDGNMDYAELGYINIEELKAFNAELDFYWTPMTLEEIKEEKRG